jgi:ADP-heptose:LPS heptosyltransferase
VAVSARVVLALRALGLGDLLTAVPALRALRRAFPDATLVLACPQALHPLVRLWSLADEPVHTEPLAPVPRIAERVDVAVNVHGRGPQSTERLVTVRPGTLVAFAHPDVPDTAGFPQWQSEEHEVARWCRLLSESGIPADPGALDLPPPVNRCPDSARVVVHPGAASAARRWPAVRWAAVARALAERGYEVVLTGSPGERSLCSRVAAEAGLAPDAVLAGRTPLVALAALVGRARVLLCGDTGVAHLATALGTPSVVLFGPTPPALWGPPPERTQHRVLWAGRTGDPHGSEPDPGLLEIGVADVLEAAIDVAA